MLWIMCILQGGRLSDGNNNDKISCLKVASINMLKYQTFVFSLVITMLNVKCRQWWVYINYHTYEYSNNVTVWIRYRKPINTSHQ